MNVNMKYDDVDSTVSSFQKGVDQLTQVNATLKKILQDYDGGGFQGQSADLYVALVERKIALVDKLRETYENAIQKLQEAKAAMQDTDKQLKDKVAAI
jgi:uncharacterized protein YukE